MVLPIVMLTHMSVGNGPCIKCMFKAFGRPKTRANSGNLLVHQRKLGVNV